MEYELGKNFELLNQKLDYLINKLQEAEKKVNEVEDGTKPKGNK